jgi:hypothetical protein
MNPINTMKTYDTLSEVMLESRKEACGCRGGRDTQYYKDEAGLFGFINHERGTTIELRDGLTEVCPHGISGWENYKEAIGAYQEWYDASFLREFEKEVCFHTPLVAKVLHEYDSSDGHGGDLHPIIAAEQCVDRYIKLLAEDICEEPGMDVEAVEKEIRERITDKGQTEEEIRLALRPSVKKALESLDKPVTESPDIDLF